MKLTTLTGALGAATLLAGGLSAQYTSTSITNAYTDISTTGTSLGLSGLDDAGAAMPIGFGFNFYGATFTSINACTNGYLTTGGTLGDFSPDCPSPNTLTPNSMIGPFWDDLSCVDHGELYYQTFGSPGSQVTIVQWEDSSTFDSSLASLNFQVHLFEGAAGKIQFHYDSLTDPSAGFPVLADEAFVGLENPTGTSSVELTCNSGAPFLVPTVSAFEFTQVLPFISAPEIADPGDLFAVTGAADPGTFYVFAYDLNPGPIGPIPLLEGITLDLGLTFKLSGAGLTPASGDIASDTILTPAGFGGTTVYWQAVTISGFGPISGVKKSNSDNTTLTNRVAFFGSIDSVGVSDHYEFDAVAGDVVTIEHCRVANLPDGTGTLDPYLCLQAPSGVIEATNDDSNGECLVDGPFGASIINGHTILETTSPGAKYRIYASSFQGTVINDETGPYKLIIDGTGAINGSVAQTADEAALCPGQPFQNEAAKMIQNLQPEKRRR